MLFEFKNFDRTSTILLFFIKLVNSLNEQNEKMYPPHFNTNYNLDGYKATSVTIPEDTNNISR